MWDLHNSSFHENNANIIVLFFFHYIINISKLLTTLTLSQHSFRIYTDVFPQKVHDNISSNMSLLAQWTVSFFFSLSSFTARIWGCSCVLECNIVLMVSQFFYCCFVLFFFYFYLPHNNYKKYRKRRKKKWRGVLTETIGAYERLGLLEFWARAVSHQLKKRRRKVKDGKTLWTVFILTQ